MSEHDPRRALPAAHRLLEHPAIAALRTRHGAAAVRAAVRATLEEQRARLARTDTRAPSLEALCEAVRRRLAQRDATGLRRALNATGVLLHTGLGRAVLAPEARARLDEVARGACVLEISRETGERGVREHEVARALCALTGAEAASCVNNGAAACLLMLAALCAGREVVVARGQLVEIGGSFRIPEILAQSGARLREVGATNRVRPDDYARAIGPETAAILHVHTSNYRVVGFHEAVPPAALARLAHEHGLLLLQDLGSGNLVDLSAFGLPEEPLVGASLRAGADVVVFSGDKLLGGPQAGLICGRREPVARMRRHPLFRALRPDKLQLAALEATLAIHEAGRARERIPVFRQLASPLETLRERGASLCEAVGEAAGEAGFALAVCPSEASAGSGALPAVPIPSIALTVAPARPTARIEALARSLRLGSPPVFTRRQAGRLWCDLRTVAPEEDTELVAALRAAFAATANASGAEVCAGGYTGGCHDEPTD
ncbi:MAG: L-seryl-tRNA(Sec) selenium transferase [Planctomycetota bacterium]|nr:MAG: L-seryl-tRNA(Sec) selenium transferase [Planctomycetota bacterium]